MRSPGIFAFGQQLRSNRCQAPSIDSLKRFTKNAHKGYIVTGSSEADDFSPAVHTKAGDIMQNSLWTRHTGLPRFPVLDGERNTDVLIVGGGMAGILCAKMLAREGADYVLIEADTICRGVTGNTTAKITSQHGLVYSRLLREFDAETARSYWEANQAALAEYRVMARNADCDLECKDNYIFSRTSSAELEQELAALRQLGIPADYAEDLPLPFPTAGAIRFRDQAQFHPLKFVSEIARDLQVYEHTRAREFIGNTVVTDRGRINASRIVVATHFPILNKHGGYFLKLYQQRSYVLALENAQQVEGMYLDAAEKGLSLRNYGSMLLVGGGGHRTGKKSTGWKPLEEFARKYYPQARERFRWATQDCMSLDGMPYIGQYSPGTPQLYVATGFNKWGMTSAMVSAMLLTDLLQGKANPYEGVFSPSRRMLRPQLLANGGSAAINLLTPTVPRCPHLGCALKWNPWEHSWDCPCHGSRFSEDGTLLDNPADGDLKKKRKE